MTELSNFSAALSELQKAWVDFPDSEDAPDFQNKARNLHHKASAVALGYRHDMPRNLYKSALNLMQKCADGLRVIPPSSDNRERVVSAAELHQYMVDRIDRFAREFGNDRGDDHNKSRFEL